MVCRFVSRLVVCGVVSLVVLILSMRCVVKSLFSWFGLSGGVI